MKKLYLFILIFFNVFYSYSENEFNIEIKKKAAKKIKSSNLCFQIIIKSDTFDFIKIAEMKYSIINNYERFKYYAENIEYEDTATRNCKFLIYSGRQVYVLRIDLLEMCKICRNSIEIVDIEKIKRKSFNYLIRYCNYFYYGIDGIRYKRRNTKH